jgi:hypothetical protein
MEDRLARRPLEVLYLLLAGGEGDVLVRLERMPGCRRSDPAKP